MGLAAIIVLAAGVAPASAATTTSWGEWADLAGSPGAYTSEVVIADTPLLSATVTSDSRGGQVGVISGASTWLSEGTPIGQKYGSSRDREYLNLRPKADNSTSPSTTTYSFNRPAPASGWAFALGDIDADQVQVRAIGPDGVPLTAAQLGFRGGFNYCAPGVVGKPSCTGDAADVPVWDAATATLTGNTGAVDTSGSAAWFEPTASISSLTFVFTRRSGFPVYQTWFASLARDVSGTVTDEATGSAPGVAVRLVDATGAVVAETTTLGDGSYAFTGVLATDGYTVEIVPPPGKTSDATRQPVDLTDEDGVADFSIRDIIPVPVSGVVRDDEGNPLGGVTVLLDDGTRSTVTASDGTYLFDDVAVGQHTLSVQTPDGYAVASSPAPVVVPPDSEEPITDQDFVLTALPELSGAVTVAGAGVAGVTVTAVGPEGPVSTVTGADGSYRFAGLAAGDYTVTIQPPDGYTPVGPVSREETVAGADVPDVDFELARLGLVSGIVSDEGGTPVPGAEITIAGPDGQQGVVTDADGGYAVGSLPPGQYTITITLPDGYSAASPTQRMVTITAAGELIDGQDFTLTAIPAPTPTPSDTGTPTPTGTPDPAGALPATGVDASGGVALAIGLIAAGVIAAGVAAATRHHREAGSRNGGSGA